MKNIAIIILTLISLSTLSQTTIHYDSLDVDVDFYNNSVLVNLDTSNNHISDIIINTDIIFQTDPLIYQTDQRYVSDSIVDLIEDSFFNLLDSLGYVDTTNTSCIDRVVNLTLDSDNISIFYRKCLLTESGEIKLSTVYRAFITNDNKEIIRDYLNSSEINFSTIYQDILDNL